MLHIHRVIVATAVAVLLCACGSKDSSSAGGSSSSSGSSFSLGTKSPGNQVVDAYNQMEQGNLDPLVNLMQLPDTTTATREHVRNGFAELARAGQGHQVHVDLVNENVTGDLATVTMTITSMNDGRQTSHSETVHMIRSGGRWYYQAQQ